MRLVLWHGYLLSGSGSNLYTANIAREWRDVGHDVLLLCQDRRAGDFSFVDAQGDFGEDNRSFSVTATGVRQASGRCRVVRPSVGDVLPVYVYDEYEGFIAKRFIDLTDEELDHYTRANIDALITAIEEHRPEAIITGHEVMGPYIAARACDQTRTDFVAKLHGSALEFAVKKQSRYREFAREGLARARVVIGGSEYMVREAASVVPGWAERAVVVNPGCDVELFGPMARRADAPPTIGYVGKLIVSKGVHHLLAALGLTTTTGLRAVVVGYGGFEPELRRIAAAISSGDFDAVASIARAAEKPLMDQLLAFIDAVEGPRYVRRAAEIEVEFAGRLDHEPLSRVLPTFDLLLVPSVVPEAFGMVAAEAAACGVLPVVPRHSGIGEVGAALEGAIDSPGLLTYDPADPIAGIAGGADAILALDPAGRAEMEGAVARFARRKWSWKTVAGDLLAHATAR
ncbi:MAG: glycosyltransferase family 4 protein [Actinomycetota bacterium]